MAGKGRPSAAQMKQNEINVMQLAARGLSAPKIAAQLQMSKSAVYSIYRRVTEENLRITNMEDVEAAIDRIYEGASSSVEAAALGMTRQALGYHYRKKYGPLPRRKANAMQAAAIIEEYRQLRGQMDKQFLITQLAGRHGLSINQIRKLLKGEK